MRVCLVEPKLHPIVAISKFQTQGPPDRQRFLPSTQRVPRFELATVMRRANRKDIVDVPKLVVNIVRLNHSITQGDDYDLISVHLDSQKGQAM
jgi:hypothetical protein